VRVLVDLWVGLRWWPRMLTCLHPGGHEEDMKTLLEATFISFISGSISTVFISVAYPCPNTGHVMQHYQATLI
jgi:hypothetical protein